MTASLSFGSHSESTTSSVFARLVGDAASMFEDGGTGGDGEVVVVEVISLGVGGIVLEESVVKETVIVGKKTLKSRRSKPFTTVVRMEQIWRHRRLHARHTSVFAHMVSGAEWRQQQQNSSSSVDGGKRPAERV